ncbi:hypothetical protein V8F20_012187 [Naviculisporaceae sp. PSN 640]
MWRGSRGSAVAVGSRSNTVFVCSVLQETSQPVLLRSYAAPGGLLSSHLDVKIWEACRATSAATSFFDPIEIGPFGQKFSDGATGWNNPVRQVYSEARRIWPNSQIQCLVSIGTGKHRIRAFGDDLKEVARTLVRMATETELTAEEFFLDHEDLGLKDAYFRFNVPHGLEEVGLQEYSAVPTIASATMTYLESPETSESISQCVERLQASACEEAEENEVEVEKPTGPDPDALTTEETSWLHSLYTADYAFHKSTIPRPVDGTCRWFLQHSKYTKWDEADSSSLLWVSGDPGCGKSVLSSFLVDKLTLNSLVTSQQYTTLYFFCDDKMQDHRDASAIMRGILHQLVSDRPGVLKRHGGAHFKTKGTRAANELLTLWDLFQNIIQDEECPPLVIVIDALDECEEKSRHRFLSLVAEFYSGSKYGSMATSRAINAVSHSMSTKKNTVKMLITSRPEISIAESFEMALDVVRLKAEEETANISKDVLLVTQQRLQTTLSRFNPPAHVMETLTQRFADKAGHTFLWSFLMIQMIERSAEASEEALEEMLMELPDGLDDIYERILARCGQGRNRQKARNALHVIVSAARALTLDELNFAISVRPGDTSVEDLQPRMEPNLSRTLQILCGPFIKITTNSTVMLVHQTAKEFLVRHDTAPIPVGTLWKHSLDPVDSHLVMARVCLLALTQKRDRWKKDKTPLAWYALDFWIKHFLECEDRIDAGLLEHAMSLRRSTCDSYSYSIDNPYAPIGTRPERVLENLPYSLTRGLYYPETALGFASLCGFRRIMGQLLDQGGNSVNEVDDSGRTPLDYAALSGRPGAVKLLLDRGADPNLGKPGAVKLAVVSRSPDILHMLISSGAQLHSRNGSEEMALAVETGHDSLVRLLIGRGVRPDVKLDDETGDTPLIFIAKRGSPRSMVETFLDSLDCVDNLGRTALHRAAEYGHMQMVKLLVTKGAKVNHRCSFGDTALNWAVKGANLDMARYLLDQGADPNLPDNRNSTPLWWAVIRGYKEMVTLLLPLTRPVADTALPGGRSLAWWARKNGQVEIARMVETAATRAANPRQGQQGLTGWLNPVPEAAPATIRAVHMNSMVRIKINGTEVSAIVDTGAAATIMTPKFAEKCGIMRLIDRRYSGVARGVGTAKILGRVHYTQFMVGEAHLPGSVTIMEGEGFDLLLGLDLLRRWGISIDFRRNMLVSKVDKIAVPMFESLASLDQGDLYIW